ncbi:cell division protein ZipA C-terminal FtsZ-binding domain-containing protein [Arenicella xantha]|uniref:Cell division protein ZipA n=1 Tax=Arenicella xantha TaxID=644221 RepID=A0A395JJS7_9GAMM|nr:cell division protein ZipA C-terminal FtsZ-binding domain-containing protein [Arenicella xantha]RBP50982.1 ZipA-like protein with FtsZ-binding domain [Arenicella xantha]
MADLYLIFFAVGLILFAAIVAFSYLQKRSREVEADADFNDPLSVESVSTSTDSDERGDSAIADVGHSEADEADALVGNQAAAASAKREPSIIKPSSPQQARPEPMQGSEPSLSDSVVDSGQALETVTSSNAGMGSSKPLAGRGNAKNSSPITELVARIKNSQPIEQKGLLVLFRKHDFKFHRNVHIYGLNELTEMWRDIEFELPSARFTELGVAIQLADRDGAMSKKELHDFQQMVLEFTNTYDAPFEFSMDIDEALKQAEALDQLGRRYDSMAVLNVVPRSKTGFRMADIESCARDLMMATDKNGIFLKTRGHKSQQTVLYRLACTDGSGHFGVSGGASMPVHDLVVYMNVPATEDPEVVFQDMVKDANSLATWLDGKVVDRAGRVMTQRSYSTLMQQVSDIAFSMQQDGLMPGDAISKKLF